MKAWGDGLRVGARKAVKADLGLDHLLVHKPPLHYHRWDELVIRQLRAGRASLPLQLLSRALWGMPTAALEQGKHWCITGLPSL